MDGYYASSSISTIISGSGVVVDVVHDASSPSIWNRMDTAAAMIRRGGYAGVGFAVVFVAMGCGGSKVEELQLVTLCRERKEFIKAASRHRYALAAAHVTYFESLKDIGEAIRKFVDEEIVISGADSSSSHGSPKKKKRKKKKTPESGEKHINSSSSSSILHSVSVSDEIDCSHLHLSSGSDSESEHNASGHIHLEDSPVVLPDQGYSHPPLLMFIRLIGVLRRIHSPIICSSQPLQARR
ncbi:hypothetical protein SDJN02_05716 [Cucurbita argyrosperma subsp. argyrosperma]|nr:hypothetical protein SDJN02_05716 [Cucurbita argyrosperma subsp. argyrosperma]